MTNGARAANTAGPRKLWYLLAGLLALAGLVAGGLAFWLTLTRIGDDLQRASFPGQAELALSEAGTYTIFVERSVGSSLDPAVGDMFVQVISPRGESLELSSPSGSFTYTLGGQTGEAVLEFEASEGGTFLIVGDYPNGDSGPPVTLAVGKGFGGRLFAGIGAVILFPLLTWSVAIVIVIVTFVRRRRVVSSPSPTTAV
ncbi:MAG: hypothetical protein WEF28_08125 [Acidimicrobiia bacterium]